MKTGVEKVQFWGVEFALSLFQFLLPLQGLTIKKVLPNLDPITFKKLWPRITNLIFSALQVEADPKNAQLLLGKLKIIIYH